MTGGGGGTAVVRAKRQLVVTNVTRGQVLVRAGRKAGTHWSRLRGLIGSDPLGPGEGLLIAPGGQIHTHFMSFPIDALYLDRDLCVVGMDCDLRPWRLGRAYRGARYTLELPAGTLAASGTRLGDEIAWDDGRP
jgi:uncharacterized membrane protein (UPF0127 family)